MACTSAGLWIALAGWGAWWGDRFVELWRGGLTGHFGGLAGWVLTTAVAVAVIVVAATLLAGVLTRRLGLVGGRLAPPLAHEPRRPGWFALVSVAGWTLVGVLVVRRALAGGARVVDASASSLLEFLVAWLGYGLAVVTVVSAVWAVFEVIVDKRAIEMALRTEADRRGTSREASTGR